MTRSSSTFQVSQDSLIALALCLVIIYYKTQFCNLCLSRFYVFVFSEKSCSKIISMAEEVALDLEELRQLQNITKRPRVLNLIKSEISNLEKVPIPPFTLFSPLSFPYNC